jgi:hypothetical protein
MNWFYHLEGMEQGEYGVSPKCTERQKRKEQTVQRMEEECNRMWPCDIENVT